MYIHIHMPILNIYRYSVGLGLIEKYLGKDNILNIPNAYYGVLLYMIQIALGMSIIIIIVKTH